MKRSKPLVKREHLDGVGVGYRVTCPIHGTAVWVRDATYVRMPDFCEKCAEKAFGLPPRKAQVVSA